MAIQPFKEKDIRNKIIEKINPVLIKGKHTKGVIEVAGVEVGKVKLPNNHDKVMYGSKSRYIARDLKLNDVEFNELIKCPLSGSDYYQLLKSRQD